MLLEALVACAGVTLNAVATALDIPVRGGTVHAEGDLDFRGRSASARTSRSASVRSGSGSTSTPTPTEDQLASLLKLTERYCVIYQTIKNPPVDLEHDRPARPPEWPQGWPSGSLTGRVTVKVVPRPGSVARSILPRCCSTML